MELTAKEIFETILQAVEDNGLMNKEYINGKYMCTHFVIEALPLVGLKAGDFLPGGVTVVNSIDKLKDALISTSKGANPPEGVYVFYKRYDDRKSGHTGFVWFDKDGTTTILHNGSAGGGVDRVCKRETARPGFDEWFTKNGEIYHAQYKQIILTR